MSCHSKLGKEKRPSPNPGSVVFAASLRRNVTPGTSKEEIPVSSSVSRISSLCCFGYTDCLVSTNKHLIRISSSLVSFWDRRA